MSATITVLITAQALINIGYVIGLLPVALLAGLVVTQTAGGDDGIVIDARLAAVALAVVLLWLRANFVVVVFAAAALAAGLRALGWG